MNEEWGVAFINSSGEEGALGEERRDKLELSVVCTVLLRWVGWEVVTIILWGEHVYHAVGY